MIRNSRHQRYRYRCFPIAGVVHFCQKCFRSQTDVICRPFCDFQISFFFCLSRMSPTGNGPFWSTRIAFLRECLPNVSELGIVANGSAAGFTNGCRLVMAASDPDGQGGFYPLLSFFFPVCVCVGVCLFIDDRSTAFDRRAKEMQPVARRTWSQKPPDHDLVLSLSR